MDKALHLAEQWSSASDNHESASPKDMSNNFTRLADQWSSASGESDQVIQNKTPVPVATEAQTQLDDAASKHNGLADENTIVPAPDYPDIADQWSSEDNETGIADVWSSASDEDSNPLNRVADEWSSASDTERDLDDERSSASDIVESPTSSLPTVNSQMAISSSRITLDRSLDGVLLPQNWPAFNPNDQLLHSTHNQTLEIPSPGHVCPYGPEHFSHLNVHMFRDHVPDDSEDEDMIV